MCRLRLIRRLGTLGEPFEHIIIHDKRLYSVNIGILGSGKVVASHSGRGDYTRVVTVAKRGLFTGNLFRAQ